MIKTLLVVILAALAVLMVGLISLDGASGLLPDGLNSREADRIIRGTMLYLAAIAAGSYWLLKIYLPGRKKKARDRQRQKNQPSSLGFKVSSHGKENPGSGRAITLVSVDHGSCEGGLEAITQALEIAGEDLPAKIYRIGSAVEVLPTMSDIRIVSHRSSSSTRALNQALDEARGDTLFLAPSCRVITPRWRYEIAEALDHPKRPSILGVLTLSADGRVYSCGRRLFTNRGVAESAANIGYQDSDGTRFTETVEVDSVGATLVYIKAEVAQSGVRFDERFDAQVRRRGAYPRWLEWDDFCLQASLKSFKTMCCPRVRATTLLAHENEANLEDAVRQSRNRYYRLWEEKWGWNPVEPSHHGIHARWGETPLAETLERAVADHTR